MNLNCTMLLLLRFVACGRVRPLAALLPEFRSTSISQAKISSQCKRDDHPFHSASRGGDDVIHRPFFPIYYNDVYEVDLPPGHRFPMAKYRKVRETMQAKVGSLSEEEQRRVYCEFRVSPLATREQLVKTHDAHYIRRYLSGEMTETENRNIGFPWSPQHVNRTLSSVGGTVAAACAAWEEYLCRYEYFQKENTQLNRRTQPLNMHLCWAAHIAGGTHHAFKSYGEGFCIFSDIAVAANELLQRYEKGCASLSIRRILIIDLDVHQGNGNAALFDGNDKVQTFSMHCGANYFSKKERSDLDVELPIGCGDETYLSTLKYWLKRIRQHQFTESQGIVQSDTSKRKQFDLIFFQSGVDIHQQDRLGRLSITPCGISQRNAMVFDFAHKMESPLVICMGGGYPKSNDWSPIIEAHTGVYWEAHQYLSEKQLQCNVEDGITTLNRMDEL